MAKLIAARGAQWPLMSEFTFNFDDTMVDVNGVEKTFGKTFGDLIACYPINLPDGAVVVGGELVIEAQGVGPTAYTVSLGDAASATRYLNASSLLAAVGTRTALTLTGFRTTENIRMAINSTVANATAGKFTIRVLFTLPGKVNEPVPN
jgi:hypothetical protein